MKDKYKYLILTFCSTIFFIFNSFEYIAAFLAIPLLNIVIGRSLHKLKSGSKLRKPLFICGIVIDTAILALGKTASDTILPIGLSVFSFKAVSYLSDIYHSRVVPDDDLMYDFAYLTFFGQLQSGPISRYKDMAYKGRSAVLISNGVYRFLTGFSKKVLIADVLGKISKEVFASDFSDITAPYAWLGAICWSLELFFDFSGYSDMAIGISGIFGFDCPENFIYPYTTESISKFWRKWHITLGAWFRDYIYIPLGGSRSPQKWRVYVNLFVVWMLTGLWHGITLNFIVWGLIYFALISFEKLTGLPDRIGSAPARIIYRVFVLVAIVMLWVIFRCEDLSGAIEFIKHMAVPTIGIPEWNIRVAYLIRHYWVFIAAGLLFSTPAMPALGRLTGKVKGIDTAKNILMPIVVISLFLVSVSFVVSGINDPFAYANF